MVKIYVGCAPKGLDAEAQMVLDYSIKKFTSIDYEIIWLKDSKHKGSKLYGWDMNYWDTPFCGFKWAVPELSKFKGESIYLQYNHIVLEDIAQLVDQKIEKDAVMITPKTNPFSAIKFNNKAIKEYLPSIEDMKNSSAAHQICTKYFFDNGNLISYFDSDWEIEIFDLGEKSGLPYNNLRQVYLDKYTYPRLRKVGVDHWFNTECSNTKCIIPGVFDQYYEEALNEGYSIENYT